MKRVCLSLASMAVGATLCGGVLLAVAADASSFEAMRTQMLNRPRYCAWTAVDFAHAAVRDHVRRFVREFLESYDIDGIEYDFFRHLQLFKTVANGADATQAFGQRQCRGTDDAQEGPIYVFRSCKERQERRKRHRPHRSGPAAHRRFRIEDHPIARLRLSVARSMVPTTQSASSSSCQNGEQRNET